MSSATIRVTFGTGAGTGTGAPGAHLSAEIDSRATGLNNGDTSFQPGDTAWFLVYASSNVAIDSVTASAGSVISGGRQTFSRTDDISFENDDAASLPVPSDGIASVLWIGNSLGNVTLGADGMSLRADNKGVAIARVSYQVSPMAYGISAPSTAAGLSDFPILVLVKGSFNED